MLKDGGLPVIQVKTPLTWEKPLLITQPAFWDRPGPLKKALKGAIMAKVLFIDDEQWVRDLYTAELEDEGHVVIATGDIEFALDLIETYRPQPDASLQSAAVGHGFGVHAAGGGAGPALGRDRGLRRAP
jgi:hypothetical protein